MIGNEDLTILFIKLLILFIGDLILFCLLKCTNEPLHEVSVRLGLMKLSMLKLELESSPMPNIRIMIMNYN